MAYEIACDLRYTYLLENATDAYTWSNPGPGAKRGLNRLLGRDVNAPVSQALWQQHSLRLLGEVRKLKLKEAPEVDMRTVEHSLCEFWKMERALWGLGRLKRGYDGAAQHASTATGSRDN
jgi:hypothetical protein